MYQYRELVPLNTEEIFKRVSEEDIFKIVFEEIDFEIKYKAPYREDKVGDCYFEEFNGYIVFVDFADIENTYTSKDCFEFLKRCLRLDFMQTLCQCVKPRSSNEKSRLSALYPRAFALNFPSPSAPPRLCVKLSLLLPLRLCASASLR